ncbi:MAG: phage virion morphogenesis protein, partial [Tannerellaceae bacterium]|nr:phage virion morphogenesis protein [Tannerellaceae bacterium]
QRGRTGRRSQTLLVDTGRLKKSIRKIKYTTEQIIIGTDVPYAEIHNEGGEIKKTVNVKSHTIKAHGRKAHTRNRSGRAERIKAHTVKTYTVKAHARRMNLKIPSRRFIGNSHTLARRIELHVTARFARALR